MGGVSCILMKFNVFVAAISLMGMSVEFTAHLAASFSTHRHGTVTERLGYAMVHTFPALLEGVISTAIGIVPLAFHPTQFTVKYLFGIVALAVAVGALNGFVIMPGMLALLSPCLSGVQKRVNRKELDVITVGNAPPMPEVAKDLIEVKETTNIIRNKLRPP